MTTFGRQAGMTKSLLVADGGPIERKILLLRGHRVKVQVDYTHAHAEDTTTGLDAATAPNQHRVRAAIQVGF